MCLTDQGCDVPSLGSGRLPLVVTMSGGLLSDFLMLCISSLFIMPVGGGGDNDVGVADIDEDHSDIDDDDDGDTYDNDDDMDDDDEDDIGDVDMPGGLLSGSSCSVPHHSSLYP